MVPGRGTPGSIKRPDFESIRTVIETLHAGSVFDHGVQAADSFMKY